MNARIPCAVTQELADFCEAGYAFNEDLTFDLYGRSDEGQHIIESAMITGTQHNVTTLLSRAQLGHMSAWLDVKDSAAPVLREWAAIHKHRAARSNFAPETAPNTILQSVIHSAHIFAPVAADYELGVMRGQIIAAKHIGPVDEKLLNEAIAAVDALRPKRA